MEQVIRNKELFFAIADRAQFDPNSYDQQRWATSNLESECGTTACIAGNALLLSGWYTASIYGVFFSVEGADGLRRMAITDEVKYEARKLLGLTEIEGDYLFYGTWQPREDLTVPDALRLLGKGESVLSVSAPPVPPIDPHYNEELATVYVFLIAETKERAA